MRLVGGAFFTGEYRMTSKISLYGITQELEALEELIIQDEGEISESSEELINEVASILNDKTDSVVGFIQMQEDLIDSASKRIKEMQAFKKAKENSIQRFKEYVKLCIEKTGQNKFEGKINSIKLRKPSKVANILSEDDLPLEYLTEETSIKVDKRMILTDLKNGKAISGAELIDGKASIAIGLNKGK